MTDNCRLIVVIKTIFSTSTTIDGLLNTWYDMIITCLNKRSGLDRSYKE